MKENTATLTYTSALQFYTLGMVAYCSADGTVLCFQLTTKAVEKDPARYRAPHFMCGSLTEDESAITVNTPLPDTPITLKKPANECGERSMRSLAADLNAVKRANDKKKKTGSNSDNQTLGKL
ncbi:hypothetical protein Patl1_30049 [Pistacia atlantica]|uniref:Uncharacterized protein n=1 Tax=Pistacia atlantica TaxID=434234 RepID=A0ACC1ABD5_9ROSI|nr:hypothetical protein Patl1_30049 [Pistacia atlantica]